MLQHQKITLETPGMVLFDPVTLAAFIEQQQIKAIDLLQYFNDFPAVGNAAIAQGCLLPVYYISPWDYQLVFNDGAAFSTQPPLLDTVLDIVLPLKITSSSLIVTDLFGIMDFDLDYCLNFPPAHERLGVDAQISVAPGNYAVRVAKFIDRQDSDLENRVCGYEFLLQPVASLPAMPDLDIDDIAYDIDGLMQA
ncbi:hypothetical protein [Janthinobacterium sp. RB2R34]|uniref:hypothetical protein n=1 Tax=Janthinobacterium sp. RB2R34 TaxID=3424193 RepID=UPI003F2668C2